MSIYTKYSRKYSEKHDKIFKKRCEKCGKKAELNLFGDWLCSECAAEVTDGQSKHVEEEARTCL